MINTMFAHAFGILNAFTCVMWTLMFFQYEVEDIKDVFAKLMLLALSALSVLAAISPLLNSIIH